MTDNERKIAECYSTWGRTYYDEYYGEGAPYPPVHTELLRSILKAEQPATLLDAGCGPASFLRDITDLGIELYGFDLTPEMVEEAQRIFQERGIFKDRIWQGSVLKKGDFSPPAEPGKKYDAVVCFGVMPHIPEEHDATVIQNLFDSLESGGLAVVEARNKLFGLFTMNRYSHEFFLKELIREDFLKEKDGAPREVLDESFKEMERYFRMDLPPMRKGKENEPGYDEVLSRTHNPFVMREQFLKAGFKEVEVKFYHFHVLPPMFGAKMKEFFLQESVAMEDPDDWRGHFMASAFFIMGRKP
ncbi:MAG TPA: class I SAM-dependent methyltransferase [Patescibacteria group bacterium]|nr:class I SAM-dependent methyltransferase [Patescibacteria group bacterium]